MTTAGHGTLDGRSRWRTPVVVAAVGSALAAFIGVPAYANLTGGHHVAPRTGDATSRVTMPPADASARKVVARYVAATVARDCDTARRLVLPDTSAAQYPCSAYSDARVVVVKTDWEHSRRYGRVADVDLRYEDHDAWSYSLARDPETGAWRIFDYGIG